MSLRLYEQEPPPHFLPSPVEFHSLFFLCRALLEAQEIFGLDFDPAEFDQLGRDGLGSDEEGEEVCVPRLLNVNVCTC